MSDLLATLPTLVATKLKLIVPKTRECKGISGRFNLERLKAESINTPAVLVSILDLKQTDGAAGSMHFFDLSMAAFIVTKDQLGIARDAAAANMTAALAAYIPDRTWGSPACGQARNVRGQSIVTTGFLKTAASLWAVTWTQPCTFDVIAQSEQLGVELYAPSESGSGEPQQINGEPDVV